MDITSNLDQSSYPHYLITFHNLDFISLKFDLLSYSYSLVLHLNVRWILIYLSVLFLVSTQITSHNSSLTGLNENDSTGHMMSEGLMTGPDIEERLSVSLFAQCLDSDVYSDLRTTVAPSFLWQCKPEAAPRRAVSVHVHTLDITSRDALRAYTVSWVSLKTDIMCAISIEWMVYMHHVSSVVKMNLINVAGKHFDNWPLNSLTTLK